MSRLPLKEAQAGRGSFRSRDTFSNKAALTKHGQMTDLYELKLKSYFNSPLALVMSRLSRHPWLVTIVLGNTAIEQSSLLGKAY